MDGAELADECRYLCGALERVRAELIELPLAAVEQNERIGRKTHERRQQEKRRQEHLDPEREIVEANHSGFSCREAWVFFPSAPASSASVLVEAGAHHVVADLLDEGGLRLDLLRDRVDPAIVDPAAPFGGREVAHLLIVWLAVGVLEVEVGVTDHALVGAVRDRVAVHAADEDVEVTVVKI